MKQTLIQRLFSWLRPRLRLYAIYRELGYIPWRKPRQPRKVRKVRKEGKGVYFGVKEAIPFVNGDAKRTFSHLLFRPGYMMRDYILRGQHEKYLAPFTALLVFYSFFTLLVAVVQPKEAKSNFFDDCVREFREATIEVDSTGTDTRTERFFKSLLGTMQNTILVTRLDKFPEAVDTPWKESLAAIEGDLRSKGIPLFLGNFLVMWMAMAILLRKRGISFSGAAAASAYVLCQFCVFMFLALLITLGQSTELGVILMGVLLFIDYRQLLGIKNKPALRLTVKTGLWYLLVCILLYTLLGVTLVLVAYSRMG